MTFLTSCRILFRPRSRDLQVQVPGLRAPLRLRLSYSVHHIAESVDLRCLVINSRHPKSANIMRYLCTTMVISLPNFGRQWADDYANLELEPAISLLITSEMEFSKNTHSFSSLLVYYGLAAGTDAQYTLFSNRIQTKNSS